MRHLYWTKVAIRFIASILLSTFIYSFLLSFGINNNDSTTNTLFMSGMIYLIIFGSLMILFFNVGVYQVHLPLSISFSSTRNEALKGLQFSRLTILVSMTIITQLFTFFIPSDWNFAPYTLTVLTACIYLLCCSIGVLIGSVYNKLNKTVLGILRIAAVPIGLILSAVMALLIIAGILVWLILGMSILFYGLCCLAEIRAIQKLYVR